MQKVNNILEIKNILRVKVQNKTNVLNSSSSKTKIVEENSDFSTGFELD